MHIRVGDTVQVIAGNGRAEKVRGKVLSVDHAAAKLIVEQYNRVYKHVRKSQKNPQGGRLSKEMPLSWSNVLLVCEKCGQPTRTGARYQDNGAKERFCKQCGAALGELAPPKAAYAKK